MSRYIRCRPSLRTSTSPTSRNTRRCLDTSGCARPSSRDGAKPAALRLTGATITSTGVVIATYQPAGPVRHGSYALDQP